MQDIEWYRALQKSPLLFVAKIWKLTPQPIKEEYKQKVEGMMALRRYEDIRPEHFEDFVKGKHITWQQWIILSAIEREIANGNRSIKLSVSSGHGIGKSVVLAWLMIWFLFCHKDAQVPATAPTAEQMHDILWKELASWHKKMPKELQGLFEWSSGYFRVNESPETWYARAKTARKENPEALAGVHSDHVMVIADEASGVPDEIFNTAEGSMTGPFVIVVLISNPTRLNGYFYETHHSDRNAWLNMSFSGTESPVVEPAYVARIIEKHGEDSDEYMIRVTGKFPKADSMDKSGYVPLILDEEMKQAEVMTFIGDCSMGVDPAGEGKDETVWVVRDRFRARIVGIEKKSDQKSIAEKTITLMNQYNVNPGNVYIDNFGSGANVAQELGLAGFRVNGMNVGMKAYDSRYVNLRSEAYWKTREWIKGGGILTRHEGWKELLFVRYKNTLSGKLQIMPKLDMKKQLGRSPDHADALMLTFTSPIKSYMNRELKRIQREHRKRNSMTMMKMA